jgi:hypothetical protein
MTYDHLGRLTALTRPLPGGGAGTVESVKLAYFLPPDLGKPYSAIHSMTQDGGGPADAKYLESVSFVDGMGRTRATLSEADPSAGDQGDWVASGFVDFDAKGALRRKYLEVFHTGTWQSFDLSVAPGAPYGRQRYDAFGSAAPDLRPRRHGHASERLPRAQHGSLRRRRPPARPASGHARHGATRRTRPRRGRDRTLPRERLDHRA